MSSPRPSARLLLAILLLAVTAPAVTKSHPNLSGLWKLDRDLTTAKYVKDDILVVRQNRQQVKFIYQTDDKVTGTDVFVTDGKEKDRYKTRIEKAFYRASWKTDALVITTQHVMDIFGYQSYKETDSWTLDADGKTLTQHLSDGKVAVYYYKGPAPQDRTEAPKEFRAVTVYSEAPDPVPGAHCAIDLEGTIANSMLGNTSYHLCLSAEKQAAAAPAERCNPLLGTMNVTSEDGLSAFVMNISGRYCANDKNFMGSFEVDPQRITGAFNQRLSGGSGTLEFSRNTYTMVLYGVLLYE